MNRNLEKFEHFQYSTLTTFMYREMILFIFLLISASHFHSSIKCANEVATLAFPDCLRYFRFRLFLQYRSILTVAYSSPLDLPGYDKYGVEPSMAVNGRQI